MRKLTTAIVATTILAAGAFAFTAQAQTWRGSTSLDGAAQNFTPIQKAACRGWGPHCGPGWTWFCGPRGWCRCVRC